MRVLCVNHYPAFGGPHNQFLRLNGPLQYRGWETIVLLPDERGTAADRLVANGVRVIQVPLHRLRRSLDPRLHVHFVGGFLSEVLDVRRVIRENRIDLVLVSGLVHPHAAVAATMEGVPIVWQIVDSFTPAVLRGLTVPLVARLANSVMFDGEALVDLHIGRRRMSGRTFVYYPPVDTARFYPSEEYRRLVRKELSIPDEAFVVGTVANINPLKGIEYFVRAASLIYQAQPDTWFVVVGDRYETHRRYTQFIEEEIRRSPIPAERLILTGTRPDVERYYAAMDVKLITSRTEGTTTTAMEAMSCGVPVVATDVGAIKEVVEDRETGFLVRPLDSGAIAQATIRLLRDSCTRFSMGTAGRRRAVDRFDVEICADTHAQAFEAAISNHGQRRKRATARF